MQKLFYGGTIYTMGEPSAVDAVLVDHGKVVATGYRDDLFKLSQNAETVDLKNKVMFPAFIDPHSHFFQVAVSMLQVSLDGAKTWEEMERRIRAYIKDEGIRPGTWIHARDYDQNLLPGYKHPTLEQLNHAVPDHPLVIHHKSGHMGLMNQPALNFLGITNSTKSPDGGKIQSVDGKLTGYLEENAFFEYLKRIPMFGADELLQAFMKAQQKYASYGITTVQDGMVVDQMLPMYQMLLEQNMLNLDVVLYAAQDSYDKTAKLVADYGNHHLQLGGIKIFLDGSPQGRTAWMRSPYENDDEYCGYGTMSDKEVISAFRMAAEKKTQLIAHCNGDAAAEQFLDCLETAECTNPELKQLRPVIIHGQLIGSDQLDRVRSYGAMISFFVAHVYHWGDVHLRNFGMIRGSNISPAGTALEKGVTFTFHQDAPVIEPDMMETLWCAVNRVTKDGVKLNQAEKISVQDAMKAITVNAAYQYFAEDSKGTIAPGKSADFVILSDDPFLISCEKLRDIKVLETYKEGNSIYRIKQ